LFCLQHFDLDRRVKIEQNNYEPLQRRNCINGLYQREQPLRRLQTALYVFCLFSVCSF